MEAERLERVGVTGQPHRYRQSGDYSRATATAWIYYLKTRGQGCNLIVYFNVKIKISFMEGTLEGVTVKHQDINTAYLLQQAFPIRCTARKLIFLLMRNRVEENEFLL